MGKRQIILAALILILGVAIYLNWQFSGANKDLTQQVNGTSGRNYGEAQLVNGESAGDDVFAQTKLDRKKTREASLTTIKQVIEATDAKEEDKAAALAKAEQQVAATEAEMQMETLIKAKGFTDCVVFYSDAKVSAIVKCEKLEEDQVTQIRDIIIEKTKVNVENISINEVKPT